MSSAFFRTYFTRDSSAYNPGDGTNKPFGSLFGFVNTTGGATFRILLIISAIAIMVGLGAALVGFVMSSSGRTMDMAKAKVQRLMLITLAIGTVTGIVDLVYTIFNF